MTQIENLSGLLPAAPWTDAIPVENIQIYRLSYKPKELQLYFIYTTGILLKLDTLKCLAIYT